MMLGTEEEEEEGFILQQDLNALLPPRPTSNRKLLEGIRFLHSRAPGEEKRRIIVETEADVNGALAEFRAAMGEVAMVGFDLEGISLTNYRRGMRMGRTEFTSLLPIVHNNIQAQRPVLMQMATLSGLCLIMQIGYFQKIPKPLQLFLDDQNIFKMGVNVQSDAYWMLERWGVNVRGWIDLRNICKEAEMKVPNEVELKGRMGLKQLAQIFFGELRITVECMKVLSYSNWAKKTLTPIQLYYAIFDAQIGADICGVVMEKLVPDLKIQPNGKGVYNDPNKVYEIIFRENVHVGYSRSEVPMQALKLDDIAHLDSSSEKALQFLSYIFTVCEPLVDGPESEMAGVERALRLLLRKDGGRMPKFVRQLVYSSPHGYFSDVVDKIRDDRLQLLPNRLDGRYPPNYWLQIPKICGEISWTLTNRHNVVRLCDALLGEDMEWALEMEVVKKVRHSIHKVSIKKNGKKVTVEAETNENVPKENNNETSQHRLDETMQYEVESEWLVEYVSMFGCWMCGERSVPLLIWEPIVPESYLQQYIRISNSNCLCNWAKLCVHCSLEWRLCQFETMLELGAVLDASLDNPKFINTHEDREARKAAKRLAEIEKGRAKGKWVGEKWERKELLGTLKRFCRSRFVDPKQVEEMVDQNWYQPTDDIFHELDVLEKMEWNVMELEKLFRNRLRSMCSLAGCQYLPRWFKDEHSCRNGQKWNPPKSMTQAEIAATIRTPGFYCDLDAAMQGTMGDMEEEDNTTVYANQIEKSVRYHIETQNQISSTPNVNSNNKNDGDTSNMTFNSTDNKTPTVVGETRTAIPPSWPLKENLVSPTRTPSQSLPLVAEFYPKKKSSAGQLKADHHYQLWEPSIVPSDTAWGGEVWAERAKMGWKKNGGKTKKIPTASVASATRNINYELGSQAKTSVKVPVGDERREVRRTENGGGSGAGMVAEEGRRGSVVEPQAYSFGTLPPMFSLSRGSLDEEHPLFSPPPVMLPPVRNSPPSLPHQMIVTSTVHPAVVPYPLQFFSPTIQMRPNDVQMVSAPSVSEPHPALHLQYQHVTTSHFQCQPIGIPQEEVASETRVSSYTSEVAGWTTATPLHPQLQHTEFVTQEEDGNGNEEALDGSQDRNHSQRPTDGGVRGWSGGRGAVANGGRGFTPFVPPRMRKQRGRQHYYE